jgi:hypothetical protein
LIVLTLFKYACFSHCVPVYTRGTYLRFDDLRDAAEGKDILEQHQFVVDYVSGYSYAIAKSQDTAQLNEFDGQIQLSIKIDAPANHAVWEFTENDYRDVVMAMDSICQAFGPVRNMVHVETDNANMCLVFRIEFYGVDAANRAVHSLTTDPVWGTNSEVSHEPFSHLTAVLTLKQGSFSWFTMNPALWAGDRALNSPHRTRPRVDDQGRLVGYRPAANPVVPRSTFHHPADQHNRVRRERILDGNDVRTTIMLRNIPNKMDWVSFSFLHFFMLC